MQRQWTFIDDELVNRIENNFDEWLNVLSTGFNKSKEKYAEITFRNSLGLNWSFCEMLCFDALSLIYRKVLSSDGQPLKSAAAVDFNSSKPSKKGLVSLRGLDECL